MPIAMVPTLQSGGHGPLRESQTMAMNLSWNGVLALIGSLVLAMLPIPRRVEVFRLGLFGAILAFVLADSARRRAETRDRELVALMARQPESLPTNPTTERAERLRRASLLLNPTSLESAAEQWRRLGSLARSRDGGVRSAA
jgi:hypothetical protein